METFDIYKDIAERTKGDVYLGEPVASNLRTYFKKIRYYGYNRTKSVKPLVNRGLCLISPFFEQLKIKKNHWFLIEIIKCM